MNPPNPWQRLGSVPPARLADSRDQLHHAAQLLASFGQTFATPQDDDSHRSMMWNAESAEFRSSPASDADLSLSLSPDPFEVRIRRSGASASLSLGGVTLADAYAWTERELRTELGRPEFEIPAHRVGAGSPFDAASDTLAELARWYGNAAQQLAQMTAASDGASPVRCWPHHFDIATLITLPDDPDGSARSIGVGMSPGDGGYPEPYAYVTPWPYPWEANRPELAVGHWHTEGWLGAVLTADAWVEGARGSEPAAQEARVRAFLQAAVTASRGLLGV